ncbi:MAG TPA: ribonuclease HI family protein [Candidatus Polarisedimenticolia bacterium]|nr:ribonuclease HI family protein [Candidatus Polarisedimenticolia bacterium]
MTSPKRRRKATQARETLRRPRPRTRPILPPEARPLSAGASDRIIANIDGGARGNPGPSGFGVHIQDEKGNELARLYGFLGHQTNNVAEYAGLLAALRYAAGRGITRLRVRSDSELLVRQINGEYRVKNPVLQRLHQSALALMDRVGSVRVEHVRREENKEADRLANEAMDSRTEQPAGITEGLLA